MAGIHRSSTLVARFGVLPSSLGMAGIHRSSTLLRSGWSRSMALGMAGIHRSSTLLEFDNLSRESWGWPGFTAQVHFARYVAVDLCAGDGRDSPLKYTGVRMEPSTAQAGDGRDSPLKYTLTHKAIPSA